MDLDLIKLTILNFLKENNINEKPVFGDGKENATIMLIGEAPGANEVKIGRPFVGKAGKNLDIFLQSINLQRNDLYITNVVKIRPSKISKSGNLINRPPSKKEIDDFKQFLLKEIEIVKPKYIVTLGNTPLSVFINYKIGDMHGKLFQSNGNNIFPLYHPAAIIYNRKLEYEYYNDLSILKEIIKNNIFI